MGTLSNVVHLLDAAKRLVCIFQLVHGCMGMNFTTVIHVFMLHTAAVAGNIHVTRFGQGSQKTKRYKKIFIMRSLCVRFTSVGTYRK